MDYHGTMKIAHFILFDCSTFHACRREPFVQSARVSTHQARAQTFWGAGAQTQKRASIAKNVV